MVDMKRTSADNAKDTMMMQDDQRDFPYGLSLRLEDPELNKLGVDFKTIGDTVSLVATAKVERVSETANNNGVEKSVSLQIVDMEVKKAVGNTQDPADVLYRATQGAEKF